MGCMQKRKKVPSHQIHSPNYSHRIRQQMPFRELIKSAQMRKSWRADLTPIRPLASIADNENAHFSLGRLDGAVRFARRDGISFGEEEEVVDEGFHVFLHGGAGGRGDFVVFNANGAGGHFVQALVDDAEALAEFFHAA